jgi:formate dehydrogenase alpha subunit
VEEITLTINGKSVSCSPGTSILDAALKNGIKIPTLCHHPHLEPTGACRLCLVEDEVTGRVLASCVTPAAPHMVIWTDSPAIKEHRRNIVRLLMANHPESCIVCIQGNRCELRQIAAELGVGETGLYPMPHYTGLEQANPFIVRDLSKCILCGRCIRADHELVVVGAIDYHLRGFRSHPATVHELPLEQSSCTFCGTCVSMCPTGALSVRDSPYVGSPQRVSSTVCGFCGVGCSLVMGSADNQVVEVNPSHQGGTVNRSTLCVRGHFAHDFLNVSERLTVPMIRRKGELSMAIWDEALEVVSEELLSIKKNYGPQSIAFLGSTKCTVEENYLFQKLARVCFGTNNIDNGSYGSGRFVENRVHERLGGGSRVTSLAGLEEAEVIFLLGANPTESLPVVSYYIKRASRIKGIPLVVADPRKTSLVPFSSLWLPLAPHSDCAMIHGLARILHNRGAHNSDFIGRFTEGFDSYCLSLTSMDLQRVSRVTGLGMEAMETAADLLEGKRIAFVIGHGILQQRYGAAAMDAVLNLALMTGSLGGNGKGIYVLSRENNQVGAADMGALPDMLPGRQPLHNNRVRKHWEQGWEVKLSPDPGLTVVQMIEEAEKGNLKGLYIMGENPLRSLPQPKRVGKALHNLELLVVQDILATETSRMADVVLPGAPFSEKGGSFTNLEGRIQSFERVVCPPGEAKPDWEILALLFEKMDSSKSYSSLEEIQAEIRRLVPVYSGLGRGAGQSWVNEAATAWPFHPEEGERRFTFSPLISIEEDPGDELFPFTAILGSQRFHLGSGTRTSHSNRVREYALGGEVELLPEDGKRLNLSEGDRARIISRHGSISRRVTLKEGSSQGLLFIPTAFHNNDAMELIELSHLGEVDSPGWKECHVKVEKLEGL